MNLERVLKELLEEKGLKIIIVCPGSFNKLVKTFVDRGFIKQVIFLEDQ